MADSKAPGSQQKADPTIKSSDTDQEGYPEGTHPIRPVSEQDWGPHRFEYSDLPDDRKPDPSTVAQEVELNNPGE